MGSLITVDRGNIGREHICCAISDGRDPAAEAKKAWLSQRFEEGLVFRKLDERGKVFIEYIPAEYAWCPVDAPGSLFIDCLWVSGRYQKQGWAGKLLESCIEDARAKGRTGLCAVTSKKKRPFLSDPGFFAHKGFRTADEAPPYFVLVWLPLSDAAVQPSFLESAKSGRIDGEGFVLFHTDQCPHAGKYAQLLAAKASERGAALRIEKITDREEAQRAPTAFTTWSLFFEGRLVTHEILSEARFEKILIEKGF